MKPISTVPRALATIDVQDRRAGQGAPRALRRRARSRPRAIVAEAMVALVLADAALEKFGGDSVEEVARNLSGYLSSMVIK